MSDILGRAARAGDGWGLGDLPSAQEGFAGQSAGPALGDRR